MNRYKITFTYDKDIDKTYRYDALALNFISYTETGIYIITLEDFVENEIWFYKKILEIFQSFTVLADESITLVADTFDVNISVLNGIDVDDVITTGILNENNFEITTIYTGPLVALNK